MQELFPTATGFMLGVIFAPGSDWSRRWWVRAPLIVLAGVLATVLSGEYRDSWAFVIVDIGEVALLAWISSFLVQRLRVVRHPGALRKRIGAG